MREEQPHIESKLAAQCNEVSRAGKNSKCERAQGEYRVFLLKLRYAEYESSRGVKLALPALYPDNDAFRSSKHGRV